MKLNVVLIIAGSILIYFLMSSSNKENKDDISVIQKIGNMLYQYEHDQKMKKEKKANQELFDKFDCTINNNQLVHENAGIMEFPKE